MEMVRVVFLTVLMFFVLVTVHEWGHYFFAKRAGILVREFAIGFGPKLFSYRRGETQFTLRLLPFGGYARMAGEDPEIVEIGQGQMIAIRLGQDNKVKNIYLDSLDTRRNVIRGEAQFTDLEDELKIRLDVDGEVTTYDVHPQAMMIKGGQQIQIAPKDRQFGSKTVGQRALAIVAGPVMNFILAFVLFALHLQLAGIPIENPTVVRIGDISAGMPAEEAGLKVGDIVVSVNGEQIGGDYMKMIELTSASKGKEMDWVLQRGSETYEVTMIPRTMEGEEGGKVGITRDVETRKAGFGETISKSGTAMVSTTELIFTGFKRLINNFNMDEVSGPVGTFQMTGQIAMQGIDYLTYWAAILSLYLGIFNLLPIPALDGSRLVFLGVEALRGKPVDPNREGMVHFVGFALLFLVMIAVTYNDILRLITG
ncbi:MULTISPECIES: RIP metalloprotease RseP [unclassified Paenibacillus]|uniref:RIP metalloprotease RseP n=1 Tax=unclassified Paenibacillus TaxID=185978 RepID=UPI002405CFCD|nr:MULTISPECIES: RIP metalloprotease RseP [unclassified Paenibacillus]MDF9841346.1 regulator of sigma E protease [Paenibacillus sp. PastF-2]MDF9847937.1 regulator of sigma E protease [Paenibacillus sp. PastM-2]MDF9854505.1 regulator of sigma E protease [Paenibacillus sp. PastF-1]MDH6479886.1 regulator of sigma E protease [Paenibacillus sp. PastH-2]MDH6507212.1 regulator of sigma E protease [Paenibacillus sp. PastM-3]